MKARLPILLVLGIALAQCRPFEPNVDGGGTLDVTEKTMNQLNVPDGFGYETVQPLTVRLSAKDVDQTPKVFLPFRLLIFRDGAANPDTLTTALTDENGIFETQIQMSFTAKKIRAEALAGEFESIEFDLTGSTASTVELAVTTSGAKAAADDRGGVDFCLQFDGTDDFVQFDGLFPFHQTGDRTFMAWIRRDDDANNHRSVVWSNLPSGNGNSNDKNRFNIDVAHKWGVDYREAQGATHNLSYGGFSIPYNTCTHIAITRTGNTYRFYQDGAQVGTHTDNNASLPTAIGWLLGGGRGTNSYFKGQVNDMQIWTRALSLSEVQTYKNTQPSGSESGLYGYWPFDEGTGNYAVDRSPNHINGKLGGSSFTPTKMPIFTVWGCATAGTPPDDDLDDDGVNDDDDACPTDPNCSSVVHYPSQNAYGTMLFEDRFPLKGDYDLNDMVIDYNFEEFINASQAVTSMKIRVSLRAMGASYRNGFAFELPVAPSKVFSVTGYSRTDSYLTFAANGAEANQAKTVVLAFDNGFDILRTSDGGFINTDPDRVVLEPKILTIEVKFNQPITRAELGTAPYNPFLIVNRERGREIHLPGKTPTSLANLGFFQTEDDDTNLAAGKSYLTDNNLPWCLNLPSSFPYLKEKNAINQGFLKFNQWAESGGTLYTDWYMDKPGYRDPSKVF